MNYKIEEIIKIVNGEYLQKGSPNDTYSFFCTDSRKVNNVEESIFIPLQTASRDGHDFITEAYHKGIRCFLISKKEFNTTQFTNAAFIQVNNTLRAMQLLAGGHRSKFDIPIFGITGSNGKTVVKEWLANLLSRSQEVVKNPKSYNSQIGVALSLSQINNNHQLGIFEAGISLPGEMQSLEEMIKPDMGVFTMIGAAHGASFSDEEEKIREKLLLFTSVKKLFFCSKHQKIKKQIEEFLLPKNPNLELISWGENESDTLRIIANNKQDGITIIRALYESAELDIQLPYTDAAYIENALHCWLVMLNMGFDNNEIAPFFMQLPPVQMRLELIKGINGSTIINDTYSSDLASLQIALDFLAEQKQHKKHSLILSDFAQQGNSNTIYDNVLNLLKKNPLHKLVLIGNELNRRVSHFSEALSAEVLSYQNTNEFLNGADISIFQNEAILIKGARHYSLERVVNRLEENIHRTVLNINLTALYNNVNVFKKRLQKNTKVMAMVKAFSYGSGTYEVAAALENHGVDYLAVAYVDEGILLRKKGIGLPILVLNPEVTSLEAMQHYDLEPEIYSISLLTQFISRLKASNQKLNIHIKLDTGMHRLGIEQKDLSDFLRLLNSTELFTVKSVFSHLVGSGDPKHADFTLTQLDLLNKMANEIESVLGYKFIKHISNSGGAIQHQNLQLDMVRLGIGLYGIDNNPKIQKELQQIGRLKTYIAQIKNVPKTETVGYSRAGVLKRDSRIATINIGYADGYSRRFGNGLGHVLINNTLAPIVGNVCMDMTMVDVTDAPDANQGDEVIVFGPELPVTKLAQWIDTIPYEIIAGISQRVKRIFYKE